MHEAWNKRETIAAFNNFADGTNNLTLINTVLGDERFIEVDNSCELNQMLSSISPKNIRVIEQEPVLFSDINQFNQQILGPELSQSLAWQPLLAIIMKYLFTKGLSIELQQAFNQIESKFYQRKQSSFSAGEKILISLMRALASWDKEVSILVVDDCITFLEAPISALFLKCLSELSVRTSIYLNQVKRVA